MALQSWMAACAAALVTIGCSSDDGADDGAAPKISDLALTPLEVEVGKSSAISGTVVIDDPDGDVAQIGVEVTLPDGTKQSLPKAAAQGASGMKQGQLAVALLFGPPVAGSYEFDFFVVDSKGHESNHLTTTVSGK
jgi:hypothetical protein